MVTITTKPCGAKIYIRILISTKTYLPRLGLYPVRQVVPHLDGEVRAVQAFQLLEARPRHLLRL